MDNCSGCLSFIPKIRKFRSECKWKSNLAFLNGKCPRENEKGSSKFPNGISVRKMKKCAFHLDILPNQGLLA